LKKLLELILIGWLFVSAAVLSGCASLRGKPPAIDVKLWAGDFTKAAVVRRQDKTQITCDEPLFSDYVAMTYEDFEKVISTFTERCERWTPEK
jgi:hypothetical protein